jgi:hypothetical protein
MSNNHLANQEVEYVIMRDGEPEGAIKGFSAAQAYLLKMCSDANVKNKNLVFQLAEDGLNYKLYDKSTWSATIVHFYRACPLKRLRDPRVE